MAILSPYNRYSSGASPRRKDLATPLRDAGEILPYRWVPLIALVIISARDTRKK